MIHLSTLADTFKSLVGWRNANNVDLEISVDDSNRHLFTSESDYYFSDVSQLLHLEYIDKIRLEEESLASYLDRITQAAIIDTLDSYYRTRLRQAYARTILTPEPVLSGAGHYRDLDNPTGRFVGFRINLMPYRSLTYHLSKVALQLSDAQATPLEVYLYQEGRADPLAILPLTYSSANSLHWYDVKAANNDEAIYLSPGQSMTYVLGYYEADLTGYAIRKEFTGTLCQTCRSYYKQFNEYVTVLPVALPAAELEVNRLTVDTSQLIQTSSNAGLNLQLSSYCDLTDVLTADKLLFAKAIQLKGAIKVLNDMYTSPETSRLALTEVQQDAYAENQRLLPEYKAVVKDIQLEFSGLDSVCYPAAPGGISIAHVAR